jgi:hypothetical protein
MDNLRVLKGCACRLADVVAVRIFLTDFKGDYARMKISARSARQAAGLTTIGVTALARDGVLRST